MAQRILSISGLRGIVGDGLDPAYLAEFAAAVGTLASGGTIVLSRDGRASGEMVRQAVLSGLLATGCRVLDAGIASTPTCGVLVVAHQAAGGLQLTASHNPIEWNGLKPFSSAGGVFNTAQGERLLAILQRRESAYQPWNRLGRVEGLDDPTGPHLNRVLALVDGDAIRRRQLRVVIDATHGAGGSLSRRLMDSLGCEVILLGETPDGQFEHNPEPTEQNLTGLCAAVRQHQADVGFAQDPDADRLAIVDETGRYIGEELTLALCVDHILKTRRGPVVVNGSTSRVTADVAARYGCEFFRSFVGEANVVEKMQAVSAVIGGEGNGGLIDPRVGYVRDSFAAMACVLAGLSASSAPLSAWVETLPRYCIVKDKLTCEASRVPAACAALKQAFPDARAQDGDGLRLDWPDRWLQIRASNTEPIIRVIAEAPDQSAARSLCDAGLQVVKNLG